MSTTTTQPTAHKFLSQSDVRSAFGSIRRSLKSHPASSAGGAAASPTAIEQEIFAEVSRAVSAWKESAEGRAALQPEAFDLETLRLHLDAFLKSDGFAASRRLITEQKSLSDSKIGFPIQAVSLGVAAQVDFIGGLYGSVGYAADLDDIDGTSVIYFLGALQEGVIEGGDVAVQVGLWKDSTSDLDGYYNGQNVDIDDFGGGAVFSLESGGSVVAYLIDVGVGEDDGLSEDQVLVFTIGISHYPVVQQTASHLLILTQLECEKTSEVGHDEVYFTFQPDGGTTYRYPTWHYYSMSQDSSDPDHLWNCGRSVMFNQSIEIVLWDDDDTNDDQLGTISFSLSDFSGPGATVSHTYDHTHLGNEVKYKMTAQLIY